MEPELDQDLREAIALSLQDQALLGQSPCLSQNSDEITRPTRVDGKEDTPSVDIRVHRDKPPLIYGIPGLNRKEDEMNRLARKRRASISPPAPRKRPIRSNAHAKSKAIDLTCPVAGEQWEQGAEMSLEQGLGYGQQSQASHELTSGRLKFPKGVIKRTWAFGQPRDGDIKIEEVLQRQDLVIAVLSAFQWDVEWLLNKIDLSRTKLIFIMQAKEEATKQQYRKETSNMTNLRLCFPPMAGQVNCMHSKLQLLFYKDYLRIVVPSANLVPYDWGESGVMENMIFLIDLPRLSKEAFVVEEPATFFAQELVYFLRAMGLQDDVVQGVMKFDFSETEQLAFVHTIGGSHVGDSWRRTGYCGLGRAVKSLGLNCEGPLEIDFVTSSLGSLNEGFLQTIYLAAHGDDGMTEYNWRTQRSLRARDKGENLSILKSRSEEILAELRKTFRIYFPTEETVVDSIGGPNSGGTICLQSKWYNAETFPRSLLRDCKSRRIGMLMHNKVLFARPQKPNNSRGTSWAYVGSANLSESAWGRLSQDKTTKTPKLLCRNWECGVLVSVAPAEAEELAGMEVFEGRVPVPMKTPSCEYGTSKPWFRDHHQ